LLSDAEREDEEDPLMNTMDCIVGWCGPDAMLFPNYLTDEVIGEFRRQRRAMSDGGVWTYIERRLTLTVAANARLCVWQGIAQGARPAGWQ